MSINVLEALESLVNCQIGEGFFSDVAEIVQSNTGSKTFYIGTLKNSETKELNTIISRHDSADELSLEQLLNKDTYFQILNEPNLKFLAKNDVNEKNGFNFDNGLVFPLKDSFAQYTGLIFIFNFEESLEKKQLLYLLEKVAIRIAQELEREDVNKIMLEASDELDLLTTSLKKIHGLASIVTTRFNRLLSEYLKVGCNILSLNRAFILKIEEKEEQIQIVSTYINSGEVDNANVLEKSYKKSAVNKALLSDEQLSLQEERLISGENKEDVSTNFCITYPIYLEGNHYGTLCLFDSDTQTRTARDVESEILAILSMSISHSIERQINEQRIRLANAKIRIEEKKANKLLLNILPKEIAYELKSKEGTIAQHFPEVTVLFADLVGFTEMASVNSAKSIVGMLNTIFSEFDQLSEDFGLEKIKTIGDSYMVVSGLPTPDKHHLEKTARFALTLLQKIKKYRIKKNGMPLKIRIGMSSGSVVAGVIGKKKFIYDVWGDAVNLASRMESSGVPDKIQTTQSIQGRLKNSFVFEERGAIEVKGKGKLETYFLIEEK